MSFTFANVFFPLISLVSSSESILLGREWRGISVIYPDVFLSFIHPSCKDSNHNLQSNARNCIEPVCTTWHLLLPVLNPSSNLFTEDPQSKIEKKPETSYHLYTRKSVGNFTFGVWCININGYKVFLSASAQEAPRPKGKRNWSATREKLAPPEVHKGERDKVLDRSCSR